MSEPGIPTRWPKHLLEYVSTGFAIVVSLISLWVAIGTERANRQMVAASSWPMLSVDSSNVDPKGHSVLMFASRTAAWARQKFAASKSSTKAAQRPERFRSYAPAANPPLQGGHR